MHIQYGVIDIESNDNKIKVIKKVYHENYQDGGGYFNDVGVLTVSLSLLINIQWIIFESSNFSLRNQLSSAMLLNPLFCLSKMKKSLKNLLQFWLVGVMKWLVFPLKFISEVDDYNLFGNRAVVQFKDSWNVWTWKSTATMNAKRDTPKLTANTTCALVSMRVARDSAA